jgi:hypothetical protein
MPHVRSLRPAAASVFPPVISLISACYRPVILPVILLSLHVMGFFEATENKGLFVIDAT